MSHLDEGTIQALLDGELDAAEQSRLERHVETCPACAARVAEARGFQREADRLVDLLAVPSRPVAPPVRRRRPVPMRTLAWAASLALAVSLGYWGRGVLSPAPTLRSDAAQPGGATERPAPTEAGAPPAGPVQEARQSTDSVVPAAKEHRAAAPPTVATPAPAAPAAKALAAAESDEREGARANEVQRDAAVAAAPAWRVVTMEEAVTQLGGQIRLIDGLTPERVEVGPGTALAGADVGLPVVRISYAGGGVVLDQQRPTRQFARMEGASAQAAKVAEPSVASDVTGRVTTWQERDGIRFVVTGSVSPDSLAALARRVR